MNGILRPTLWTILIAKDKKATKNFDGWVKMIRTYIWGIAASLFVAITALADDHVGRNESSVPRNSVLPFSPAIATAQIEDSLILKAKLALHTRGYEVGTIDGFLSARFLASLIYFQRDNGLSETGKLDTPTREALKVFQQ